jgi:replicative DNA helicase
VAVGGNVSLQSLSINNNWESFLSFRKRRLQGLQTGLPALDKVLLGLSGITLIQGAPGSCKSSLAMQIALHNAKSGTPVVIIDRENGRDRFRTRLVCCYNTVSSVDVLTTDEETLGSWVAPLLELPMYHSTTPTTPEGIRLLIAEALEHFNRPILLVVDSLQAMPPLTDNERMSLQQWLNELDQIKLDHEGKVTIVVTSEKSRGQDNYDKASMSSSKGAGAIEYKSEIVLDLRQAKDGGLVLEILKNRDGIANVAIDLQKVLADKSNPASFSFRLSAA